MFPTHLIKRFNNTLVFFLLILLTAQINATPKDKHASIWEVIESFKLSIQTKDEALFMTLFYDKNVSWIGVISDETREALIAKNEKFRQQPKIRKSSPEEFIQNIVKSPEVSNETFQNVKITQDSEVASVSFDYQFFKDEKLNNSGQENWQLINTVDGWKINAVNFSFTLAL